MTTITRTPHGDYRCTTCGTDDLGPGGMHMSRRYDNGARYPRGSHTPERCATALRARQEIEQGLRQQRLTVARSTAFDRLLNLHPDSDNWRDQALALSEQYRAKYLNA